MYSVVTGKRIYGDAVLRNYFGMTFNLLAGPPRLLSHA